MKTKAKPVPRAEALEWSRAKMIGDAARVSPPSCEHCGKPATRIVCLTTEADWNGFADNDSDGNTPVDIREIHLCDDCDYCWQIPKMEIERIDGEEE